METDTKLKVLSKGMPNSLLLENVKGDLQFVVSALASPFRSQTTASSATSANENKNQNEKKTKTKIFHPTFPYGAIYEYHDPEWVKNAAHIGHYVLPVHMSHQFLFAPTLSAALYLLMVKFFQRDYKSVCSLGKFFLFFFFSSFFKAHTYSSDSVRKKEQHWWVVRRKEKTNIATQKKLEQKKYIAQAVQLRFELLQVCFEYSLLLAIKSP